MEIRPNVIEVEQIALVEKSSSTLLPFREENPATKSIPNLAAELSTLREMLAALAGAKVKLDMMLENAPQGEVLIAPLDLTKILINLVRNSAEAISSRGNVSVTSTCLYSAVDQSRSALIAVEDDGLAIPLVLLDQVFNTDASQEMQVESESHPRMKVRSRRLGLRVVRDLVESVGGKVRAMRLPERGSRFEVILPMGAQERGTAVA